QFKPPRDPRENRMQTNENPAKATSSRKSPHNRGYSQKSQSYSQPVDNNKEREIVDGDVTKTKAIETSADQYAIPYHLLNDPPEKSKEDEQWVLEQIEIL